MQDVLCLRRKGGSGGTLALEFRAMFIFMISAVSRGIWSSVGGVVQDSSANQPAVTVIRFSVRVPVLSEQMAVAPPIVSQAANTCTSHTHVWCI